MQDLESAGPETQNEFHIYACITDTIYTWCDKYQGLHADGNTGNHP